MIKGLTTTAISAVSHILLSPGERFHLTTEGDGCDGSKAWSITAETRALIGPLSTNLSLLAVVARAHTAAKQKKTGGIWSVTGPFQLLPVPRRCASCFVS